MVGELLVFPTDYPIKVVGRSSDEFRARVHGIMLQHAPGLDAGRVGERLSENGRFLSITYIVPAESREQIEALVADLRGCEGVMMIL